MKPRYLPRYEKKTTMNAQYAPAVLYNVSREKEKAYLKTTRAPYYGTPNEKMQTETTVRGTATDDTTLTETLDAPMTIQTDEPTMTNENTRRTKQKLAQLIIAELETIGPREEHTHENGETHVH